MNAPLVGVLALQGDVREHLAALRRCGARAEPVRRPAELAAVDGLVIPGGESTTMSKLAVAFGILEPLRARVRAGLPAYGSCAGMIMLADKIIDGVAGQDTVGGLDILVRRNAFGRQVDSFEDDLDVSGAGGLGGDPLHAVFIRAPWVESAGAGVQVLARIGAGPAAGRIVAVRQDNLLATSFHPELGGDDRVHRLFVSLVRDAGGAGSGATEADQEEQG